MILLISSNGAKTSPKVSKGSITTEIAKIEEKRPASPSLVKKPTPEITTAVENPFSTDYYKMYGLYSDPVLTPEFILKICLAHEQSHDMSKL